MHLEDRKENVGIMLDERVKKDERHAGMRKKKGELGHCANVRYSKKNRDTMLT